MRRYNVVYYVLFLAVIMGAFASMAQNSYGMRLIGFACLAFSLTFMHETVFSVPKREDLSARDKQWFFMELVALTLLALLFFFRSYLIEIPAGREWILLSLFGLIVITVYHGVIHVNRSRHKHSLLGLGVFLYYSSLLVLIITFLAGVVRPSVARMLGPIGFVLLLGFAGTGLVFGKRVSQGETMSVQRYIRSMKNKSGILMIGFILMFLFFGLNQAGVFPSLYSGEMPSGYLNLVRKAESGEEKKDGKKQYELFDEQYDKFVRKLNQE